MDSAGVQLALVVVTPSPGLLLADRIALGTGILVLGDLGQFGPVQAIGPLVLVGPSHELGGRG
ncbi:MAG: hypothetical protein ACK5N0_05705 [Synechococcaceae cyanobacterium]